MAPPPRQEDDVHTADGPQSDHTDQDLTLAEASNVFAVSVATLRRLIAADMLAAHRVSGVRGREWRIAVSTLERAGYPRRVIDTNEDGPEVQRLTQALAVERAKNARSDSELGYALLTIGRLRGRLREAGVDPDEVFGADLRADLPGIDASKTPVTERRSSAESAATAPIQPPRP